MVLFFLKGRFISDFNLSVYDREIERYGGKNLIDQAETLFYADSFSVISLIKAILSKQVAIKEEIVASLSLIDLLKQLGLNLQQQLDFYSFNNKSKDMLKGFREDKSTLVSFGKAILNDNLQDHAKEGFILSEAFQARKPSLQAFAKRTTEAENKQELSMHSHMIFDSIIHMHCNRLLGRDRAKETKVRQYAFHTLTTINEETRFRARCNHTARG